MAMINRTGRKIAFLDLHIGSPFFAHGQLWVRTSFDAATELESSTDGLMASCCNFLIDGKTRPARAAQGKYYSHPGETCEEVECVEVVS